VRAILGHCSSLGYVAAFYDRNARNKAQLPCLSIVDSCVMRGKLKKNKHFTSIIYDPVIARVVVLF